ncbi:MAG: SOS response-associated peptidase [Ginsengibacter sp.]
MCYYNGQKVARDEMIRLKDLEKQVSQYEFLSHDLQIGFDYGLNAVLKKKTDELDFDMVQMEWGFIPHYVKTREDVARMRNGYKDATGKFRPPIITLNAVCEELLAPGKIYREATLKRRCLVLSTGFFEWRHVYPLNKRTGLPLKTANKYPYYISLKDRNYFFMAGVWQGWTDKSTGEYVETFAIVTTKANALMSQIHNSKKRMPVILNEDLALEWLLGTPDEKRILEIASYQYPSGEMKACTIAKDFREALEPAREFIYEDVPALELNV